MTRVVVVVVITMVIIGLLSVDSFIGCLAYKYIYCSTV